MKNLFPLLLLCSSALACSSAHGEVCPTGQPKDQAALVQIEQTWLRAAEHHDVAALRCILADEFEEAGFDGSVTDRSAMLASAARPSKVHSELTDLHAHVYGGFGYVRGLGVNRRDDGKPATKNRFTDIFVYRDGRWECVAGHESHFPGVSEPLSDLVRNRLEDEMVKAPLVFTYYIAAPIEKVWDGFVSKEANRAIFIGADFEIDLKPGGAMIWSGPGKDGKPMRYVTGEVVRAEAPKVLEYKFGLGDGAVKSRVKVELTAESEAVKVVVTNDEWGDDAAYAQNADGWPRILSRLKTLLETGKTFRPH